MRKNIRKKLFAVGCVLLMTFMIGVSSSNGEIKAANEASAKLCHCTPDLFVGFCPDQSLPEIKPCDPVDGVPYYCHICPELKPLGQPDRR
jgi:hypothetical protein